MTDKDIIADQAAAIDTLEQHYKECKERCIVLEYKVAKFRKAIKALVKEED